MELCSFDLTTSGVSVDDAEQIIDSRFNVKKAKWPDLFANLVMQFVPKHKENYKEQLLKMCSTAWYKTFRRG